MRLIDADKFLEDERERCCGEPVVGTCTMDNINLSTALGDAQTIEAEPVRYGKWISNKEPDDNDNIQCECNICRHSDTHSKSIKVPYCWFCGANME